MASELPYFRFTVSEWLNGDISMEGYEHKGLFIDICSWYWFKDCSITRDMLEKKFEPKNWIDDLFECGVLKEDGENVVIEFLNEQFDILSTKRKARQKAGSKGGKQKSSNAKAKLKQKSSYKDKDNNKDNNKIPPFDLFKQYAIEKKPSIDIHALKLKYEAWVINEWKDGNGNQIQNWKVKLLNTIPYLNETKAGENIGSNLGGDPIPENYGIRSSKDVQRGQYKKSIEK